MNYFFGIVLSSLVLFSGTRSALAVPPPDFLFNVGSQLVQFFSIAVIFLSAALISLKQVLKIYFHRIKHQKVFWIAGGLCVVAIASAGAFWYQQVQQNQAYNDWIAQSRMQNQGDVPTDNPLDQLKVGVPAVDATQQTQSTPPEATDDKYISFIRKYYADLGSGKIEDAYAVSKKSVSFDTYKSWYANVRSVEINHIQTISDHQYSLELTLIDDASTQYYAVLMTLSEDASGNLKIADSQVRTLSRLESENSTQQSPSLSTDNADYFTAHQSLPLAVTNKDFQKVLDTQKDIYVLDAREDEEFEIGNFPDSVHIRYADLVAGEWIKLPTDRTIYVFCWSGMRGKDVADFLRSKKILARYIENGASDWVNFGGKWNGGIQFSSKYSEDRYQKVFNLDEVKAQIAAGTAIVDSRSEAKFEKHHIAGSINIPMIYTPSSKIESVLSQVPAGTSVITVCDDFISCFDAKVTGIKLEKLGHTFLGRYNKPWEYQN